MAHQIPKELKGEERLFSIPKFNIHFSTKGVIYNGLVTTVAVIAGKLTGSMVIAGTLFLLNFIAYPLAHKRVGRNKFEGGYMKYDKYFLKKYLYKKSGRKFYLRKITEE